MKRIKTDSLFRLLQMNLQIPLYQRPYEWERSNILILLNDIYNEFICDKEINLGTIILLKNKNNYDIVDGQQRIISLALLCKELGLDDGMKILNEKIQCVSNTVNRIISNNNEIKEYIKRLTKDDQFDINKFVKYVKYKIKFFILTASDENEAFQLFDGRNSKFKQLDPIDLLKAYHLGAINSKSEKKQALEIWDKYIKEPSKLISRKNKIQFLFDDVLFNIYNWSLNKERKDFSKNDIYLYKGYSNSENYEYNYVKYYKSVSDSIFLLNKPFKKGISFFLMVENLIESYDNIIEKYNLYNKVLKDTQINDYPEKWFNYDYKFINIVYYDALFMFINKYGTVKDYEMEIIKDFLYKWVIIHRINNEQVKYLTINNYILNNDNFFFECTNSLSIEELYKLNYPEIGVEPKKTGTGLAETRRRLWEQLK